MKLLLINQSAQLDESNKQLVITFDFVDADGIVYRDTKYTPLPEDFSKSSLHEYAKGHVDSLTRINSINVLKDFTGIFWYANVAESKGVIGVSLLLTPKPPITCPTFA